MTDEAPQFLDIVLPASEMDAPPPMANFANVSGNGDTLVLDFFYVHPAKVERLFDGADAGENGRRDGDTLYLTVPAVAQVAVPMTTATDLAIDLVKAIVDAAPELASEYAEFAARLRELVAAPHSQRPAAPAGPTSTR